MYIGGSALEVSKFQKQIFLLSFEPKARLNQNKLLKEIELYPYQNSQHIYSTLVTVFSKCHPKSSSSSLKLISNEMVLAVSIANQIVVFTSQILRDMAITLTPNSHTHPKPKQFFFFLRKQTTISPIFCFLLLNLHGLF